MRQDLRAEHLLGRRYHRRLGPHREHARRTVVLAMTYMPQLRTCLFIGNRRTQPRQSLFEGQPFTEIIELAFCGQRPSLGVDIRLDLRNQGSKSVRWD